MMKVFLFAPCPVLQMTVSVNWPKFRAVIFKNYHLPSQDRLFDALLQSAWSVSVQWLGLEELLKSSKTAFPSKDAI